jgi:Tfp pilus assembly protein FimT
MTKHTSPAFTLIELLVSITLIVIFLAVLFPAFSGFGRRNELLQGAQLIQSRIYEARAFAQAPRAGGGAGIERYEFRAPVTVAIAGCPAGNDRYAILEWLRSGSLQVVACETLPTGLRFSNLSTQVEFSVEQQGAVVNAGSQNPRFTLLHPRLTASNDERNIVVNRNTGQVSISSAF